MEMHFLTSGLITLMLPMTLDPLSRYLWRKQSLSRSIVFSLELFVFYASALYLPHCTSANTGTFFLALW